MLMQYGSQLKTNTITTTSKTNARRSSSSLESRVASDVKMEERLLLCFAPRKMKKLQTAMTVRGPQKQQPIMKKA